MINFLLDMILPMTSKVLVKYPLLFDMHDCKLTKVLYMPQLTKIILSINQNINNNLRIEFDINNGKKVCIIHKKYKFLNISVRPFTLERYLGLIQSKIIIKHWWKRIMVCYIGINYLVT